MAIQDETNYSLKGKQVKDIANRITANHDAIGDIGGELASKQDALSETQLNAVNSGIDSTKVGQIATNASDISAINGKIPAQATSSNQLADKDFVNSSVATNTANYISDNGEPFSSLADLQAYSGTLTNNDYAFVVGTDSAGNTTYTRYKYVADQQEWAEEYVLNNSSFTANQWAAINSGITSGDVTKLAGITAGAEPNTIDSISVNGTAVTPDANKNVDLTITSPTVVQTTGTSTTDVMSQNAVTGMVFADPGTRRHILLGNSSSTGASTTQRSITIGEAAKTYGSCVAIGFGAEAYSVGGNQIAIGSRAKTSTDNAATGQIALGDYAQITDTNPGIMYIGSINTSYGYNDSAYRLLTGLYDPQSAHDAATKGYVDSVTPVITMSSTDPGEGVALDANHFIAYYE